MKSIKGLSTKCFGKRSFKVYKNTNLLFVDSFDYHTVDNDSELCSNMMPFQKSRVFECVLKCVFLLAIFLCAIFIYSKTFKTKTSKDKCTNVACIANSHWNNCYFIGKVDKSCDLMVTSHLEFFEDMVSFWDDYKGCQMMFRINDIEIYYGDSYDSKVHRIKNLYDYLKSIDGRCYYNKKK